MAQRRVFGLRRGWARYVAKALGYADKQIVFAGDACSCVSMLESAQVDMVVFSFGITERHESAQTMTGPYLIVRAGFSRSFTRA